MESGDPRLRNESKGRLFMQRRAFMEWPGSKVGPRRSRNPLVYSCGGSINVHKATSISGSVGADG